MYFTLFMTIYMSHVEHIKHTHECLLLLCFLGGSHHFRTAVFSQTSSVLSLARTEVISFCRGSEQRALTVHGWRQENSSCWTCAPLLLHWAQQAFAISRTRSFYCVTWSQMEPGFAELIEAAFTSVFLQKTDHRNTTLIRHKNRCPVVSKQKRNLSPRGVVSSFKFPWRQHYQWHQVHKTSGLKLHLVGKG